MLGTITVKDLKISCITGIHLKERELLQNLYMDIELDCDFAEAEKTEKIESTFKSFQENKSFIIGSKIEIK